MNYYNFWTWVLLYATLVIWLPLAKLLGLGTYTWSLAFAPVWVPWLLAALGGGLVWSYRRVAAGRPATRGVL